MSEATTPKPSKPKGLRELLRAATVRVQATGKTFPPSGTGVFLAPDLVLSCLHVLNDKQEILTKGELDCFWENELEKADFTLEESHPDLDLALLRVDWKEKNPPQHAWAPIKKASAEADELSPEDELLTVGFPDGRPNAEDTRFKYEGERDLWNGRLVKLRFGQAIPGMSGGALIHPRTFYLHALLGITRDENSNLGAFATPIRAWDKIAEKTRSVRPYPEWNDLVRSPKLRRLNVALVFCLAGFVDWWIGHYASALVISLSAGVFGISATLLPWAADPFRKWIWKVSGRLIFTRFIAGLYLMVLGAGSFIGSVRVDLGGQQSKTAFLYPLGTNLTKEQERNSSLSLRPDMTGSFPKLTSFMGGREYSVRISGCPSQTITVKAWRTGQPVTADCRFDREVKLLAPTRYFFQNYEKPVEIGVTIAGKKGDPIRFDNKLKWIGETVDVPIPELVLETMFSESLKWNKKEDYERLLVNGKPESYKGEFDASKLDFQELPGGRYRLKPGPQSVGSAQVIWVDLK
jgi:hypothetical protein